MTVSRFLATASSGNVVGRSNDASAWTASGAVAGLAFGLFVGWFPTIQKWILCGTAGLFSQSSDGNAWTPITGHAFGVSNVRYCQYFKGLFIAFGEGANPVQTSPDLATWTNRTTALTGTAYGMAASNSVLIGIGTSGGGDTQIVRTIDGLTWDNPVSIASAAAVILTGAAYSPVAGFVVTGAETGPGCRVMTSPAGLLGTWTTQTPPVNQAMNAVAYGNGVITGVTNAAHIFTTTNPASGWVERTHNLTGEIYAATFRAGLGFLAGNAVGRVAVSNLTGSTWAASVDAGLSGNYIRSLGSQYTPSPGGSLLALL